MNLIDLLDTIAAAYTHLAPLTLPGYDAPIGDLDDIKPLVQTIPTPASTTVLGVFHW